MSHKDASKFGRRTGVPAERFVEVWQQADTVNTVAARLKISSKTASTRAASLRRLGVRLKRFVPTPDRLDVSFLNEIADENLQG